MTPTEQDKELDLSHLKDVRAVLKWCYDHGLLKGEFPTSDSSGKVFILNQGEKRLNQLISADRKRVALEARAKVITDIELFVAQESSTYMNSKYTVHQFEKDYSDGIADGKNNAYSRLAQWLNQLKAQQEEV